MNYLKTALQYHRAGFRVIPVNEDKRPTGKWKQYQEAQSEEDIQELFAGDYHGIALLTGINGLEVIDVDEKYDIEKTLMQRFMRLNDTYTSDTVPFSELTIQQTRSGGYHILYRCSHIEGNQKLASRPATPQEEQEGDKVKVLIETRGNGGYILAYPTPGYEIQWGKMSELPTITPSQRLSILRCARMFDEMPVMARIPAPQVNGIASGTVTPWDDYNEKADGVGLLTGHGWKFVYEDNDRVYLRRPGTTDAKTSGNWHKQKRLFVCHSTSTQFEAEKGYTAHAIQAILEHAGDFSAAAKALYYAGYGSRVDKEKTSSITSIASTTEVMEEKKNSDIEKIVAFIRSTRFDINAPIVEDKATLHTHHGGQAWKMGGPGMIGGVVGPQKSSKTSIVAAITASAIGLRNCPILSFSLDTEGKNIAYFDTEQSAYFYQKTQDMIYKMGGLYQQSDKYEAFHLRRLPANQRLAGINAMLSGRKDLGLIVIDGLVDLLENFNSEVESARVMEHLLRWSDETGALILTVLHLTKAEGFMRGHLGTALQNKYDFGVQVAKDGEESLFRVKCRDSRFAPFPSFEFTKDEHGFPVFEQQPAVQQEFQVSNSFPVTIPARARNNNDDYVPF